MGPVVAVHGGAGRWSVSPEEEAHVRRALEGAVDAGLAAVARGNAVDAVVEAVAYMEDSGVFNAGVGSVYTVSGRVQMDAGVMDGASGRAGAVAAVEDVKNPVRLARYVLDATDHVLVVGEGARELARAAGLLTAKTAFYSDRKNEMFKRMRQETLAGRWHYKKVLEVARRLGVGDTVGAVALDRDGNLAAATSTGGVWLKLDGRVGDSPIPGAGFWADNSVGALSATGVGEVITIAMASLRVAELMRAGLDVDAALRRVVDLVTERFGEDTIGLLGLDRKGRVAAAFNTAAMARAWGADKQVKRVALRRGDIWP
ncbi:MAG: asparaginase [Thermoproteus sp. JCHS_4]|jgi:asparaginase (EC 3.5.1.1)|nr:MAG: asparaginase [Thermoproteus sp. JCHS_4]